MNGVLLVENDAYTKGPIRGVGSWCNDRVIVVASGCGVAINKYRDCRVCWLGVRSDGLIRSFGWNAGIYTSLIN